MLQGTAVSKSAARPKLSVAAILSGSQPSLSVSSPEAARHPNPRLADFRSMRETDSHPNLELDDSRSSSFLSWGWASRANGVGQRHRAPRPSTELPGWEEQQYYVVVAPLTRPMVTHVSCLREFHLGCPYQFSRLRAVVKTTSETAHAEEVKTDQDSEMRWSPDRKYLPRKRENLSYLSSVPSTQVKSQAWKCTSMILALGR